jgi:hypothetical protein
MICTSAIERSTRPPQANIRRSALSTCVIAAETLTHRDSHGGELVAQSWNVQWAAATAIALRSVRLLLLDVLCRYA